MMHETGKSDPAIVAMKLANEARQSAKELMEPGGMCCSKARTRHRAG